MSETLPRMSERLDLRVRVAGTGGAEPYFSEMEPSGPFLRVVSAARPKDDQIERAILAMKAAPTRRWTVASLGRVASLSRAAFARRFVRATGIPPLRWLTEHRMNLARTRLLEKDEPLDVVAGEVGYACEFAFSKAFKRIQGITPDALRRLARSQFVAPARFRAAA